MKHIIKFVTVFLVLFWSVTVIAQEELIDRSPNHSQKTYITTEAIWDVLLNFDATALSGAAGNAGAEWDGTYFYSTRWASNLIHKYNSTGTTLVEQFSISGVTGLRDLAFDGTYMYGGAAANTIYQMDFTTKTLIGTIPSPVAVRFIAYDEAADAFWVGNWDTPATLVSRTGATLATITTGMIAQYGAAYDNVSAGGPYLWIFNQDNTAGGVPQIIHQFNIATGTATGVTHDVTSDIGIGNTGALAGGLFSMTDFASGFFTIGGLLQGTPDEMFVYEIAPTGPPCPVGLPTNPNPANGAIDVSINPGNATWTNGSGTMFTEVYFGEVGNLTQIYNGSVISSIAIPGPLDYSTTYGWYIKSRNDTCYVNGPLWTFTTIQDPNLLTLFFDDFEANTPPAVIGWVITNNGGNLDWRTFATPYPNTYTLPCGTGCGKVLSADSDEGGGTGTTLLSTITIDQTFNATQYQTVVIDFDNDVNVIDADDYSYVEVSNDGGTTWNIAWQWGGSTTDLRNTHEVIDISSFAALSNFQVRFRSVQPGFDWWWTVDNVRIQASNQIPVELTSFTAIADYGVVELNWITATETNNQGFEVQRSSGSEFETIAFIEGHGTTTEPQAYTYSDRSVDIGRYSFRLKQVDFDGSFEYSDIVEVDVPAPAEFALDQNYPNPFNPSTKITFRLAVDSKVSLKVFDILGQEVAALVNGNLVAGAHNYTFNASSINSGVYLYRLEATGIDGTNFVDVKKMILAK